MTAHGRSAAAHSPADATAIGPDDRTVLAGEPDPERTLLIPRPGGRAARAAAATTAIAAPAAPAPSADQAAKLQRLVVGINPLLVAAGPLLALCGQLRATSHHGDRPGLQRQLLRLIGEFEEQARAGGIGRPQVAAARYLLCTFIDEAIASTPWGVDAPAGARGLLQEFHEDASGADKVFELLEHLIADATTNAPLLELFDVCIALGLQGRYAQRRNGRAELDEWSARLRELLRPAAPAAGTGARTLSQHWAGVRSRAPSFALVPWWLPLAVAAAVVFSALTWMSMRLSDRAAPLLQQLHQVSAGLAGAPPATTATTARVRPRVAPLLASDLAAGALEVSDQPQRSIVTLPADALFAPGSAQLLPAQRERLGRVARALGGLQGLIEVVGHTDDQPLQTLRFPSNWHLSRERAQAVALVLVEQGLGAARVRAEGRADTEPRVANGSAAARARNRRVEIVLLLPRPEI